MDVGLHDDFVPEFNDLPEVVQDELLVKMGLLERFRPQLGRPHVDTLKGSRHAKMKELRFNAADGVWRFLFALRSEQSRYHHLWRRQIRRQRRSLLSPDDRQGGRPLQHACGANRGR
jgi:phage-related protein